MKYVPTTVEPVSFQTPEAFPPEDDTGSIMSALVNIGHRYAKQGITLSFRDAEHEWSQQLVAPLKLSAVVRGSRTIILRLFSLRPEKITEYQGAIIQDIKDALRLDPIDQPSA